MPAQFPKAIEMSDIWALIKKVQQKEFNTETFKLALWIAGSGIEQFDGDDRPLFGAVDRPLEDLALELSDALENFVPTVVEGEKTFVESLNPVARALLTQIFKKLVEMM